MKQSYQIYFKSDFYVFFNKKTKEAMLKYFLIVLVCCFSTTLFYAQKYAYLHYNQEVGAPFQQVSSVVQDKEGFMWIGSQQGLYRFDGNVFENFGIHLKSQHIHRLLNHGGKVLFVNDTGLHQMDNVAEQPTLSKIIEGSIHQVDSLPFYPNDFITSPEGIIWMSQSNHTIGRYQNGQFKTYSFSKTDKPQRIKIGIEENGLVWALSELDGLFNYNRLNDSFEKVIPSNGSKTFLIYDDYLLLGGSSLKIYFIRSKSKPSLLRTIPLIEANDVINAIHLNHANQFVIGTQKGHLYSLNNLKSRLKPIYGANTPHRVEDLDFGPIHQIYSMPDSNSVAGMLWICSENGLWLLKQRFFESVNDLPRNNPTNIAIGKNKEIWVSMNGLYEVKSLRDNFKTTKLAGNTPIEAVAFESLDNLWVSINIPEVQLIKVVKNQFLKRYSFQNRGGAINYIYPDSKKNIWFCQNPSDQPIIGIAKIDAAGKTHYYEENAGFSSRILVLKESNRGEIYAGGIGSHSYLYRYDATNDQFENLSLPLPFPRLHNFEVYDLAIDYRGIVWLATSDGLFRYDSEKITLIEDDVLKKEEIRGVATLPNGAIWVATATRGLVYHYQETSILIEESSGLPSNINAYRCITPDKYGRIWAGTAEGVVYSRQSNATPAFSNIPRIKKAFVNYAPYTADYNIFKITDFDHFKIDYTCLDFHVKSSQYQYRIYKRDEKDLMVKNQDWTNNEDKNFLELTHLETGKYFLEIRSKQAGGYLWSLPLEIKIDVSRPWFKQAWFFYPVASIITFFLAYYLRFFVLRRIKKLQFLIQSQSIRLAEKQAQLDKKIKEFNEHQQDYQVTMSNVQMLELFIKAIPPKTGWNEIITAMGKAVDQSIDIAAFEIAFLDDKEVTYRGYSYKEEGGYTYRHKPFNTKTSLVSWALAHRQEVVINNFDEEHQLYIEKKDAYYYQSLVVIPFQKDKENVALCAYSIDKHQFNQNEVIMLRILVKFIIHSTN